MPHPKVVIPETRFFEARNEPTKPATPESRGHIRNIIEPLTF
jgi:hypothetical protein